MEYVILESFDGKIVRVPIEKKEEYQKVQQDIINYIKEGKTIEEIKEIINDDNRRS